MTGNIDRRSLVHAGAAALAAMLIAPRMAFAASGLKPSKTPRNNDMSTAELHAFYARYLEAVNARHYDFVATLIHDKVLMNGVERGRDDVIISLKGIIDAVPDFTWHLEELVVEGGRLVAKLRDTGTPAKPWVGLSPTGASVEFTEFCFYKVVDGRFSEMWFLMDVPAVARQLARIP